jgi:hypothetical protein
VNRAWLEVKWRRVAGITLFFFLVYGSTLPGCVDQIDNSPWTDVGS